MTVTAGDLHSRFAEGMRTALGTARPAKIGIALSGGGDSMALADLLSAWAAREGVALAACSIDHQLRPEAREEIALAGAFCAARHIPQTVRLWEHDGVKGNLQDAARQARYALLADWARSEGITHVALGHTEDDQAETVLLRLARGSGVDGLAAMRPARVSGGVTWLRPMLSLGRDALRAHLESQGIAWADDPSNEDPRFDRIKARRMMETLSGLGLTRARLAESAAHMARARDALDAFAQQTARGGMVQVEAGAVVFDATKLEALPQDTRTRLVTHALGFVGGAPYRPRFDALQRALAQPKATLQGCMLLRAGGRLFVTREPAACAGPVDPGTPWDARWLVEGPFADQVQIAALGEAGLRHCADWRETGLPREVLMSTPAVWQGGELVAAPLAGCANGFTARLAPGCDDFNAGLVTH